MKKSIIKIILGSLVFLCFINLKMYAQKGMGTLRAGASTSNITPSLGGGIVGRFGTPPPALHIHDQLFAKSLVLDDGKIKLVFVVVDNLGVKREVLDVAKRMINTSTGIPKEHILISATHTHSATSANWEGAKRVGYTANLPLDEYQQFLVERISDGVSIALNNLEPAKIGWGAGSVPQHLFNRRWYMKEPVANPFGGKDKVMMNPGKANKNKDRPAGAIDPEVSFVSVQALDGRPLALLANYSLHYVGGMPKNHVSADYFSVFADRIQELLDADRQDIPFVAMMSNGTSGDVNNINYADSVQKKYEPYAKLREVAFDVAEEVFKAYQSVTYEPSVELKAAQKKLMLSVRKPTIEQLEVAKQINALPEGSKHLYHPLETSYARRIIELEESWPDNIEIILQAFRIGDIGITAIPFETFTETGLEIKSKSPLKRTFTISIANGIYGYLPTPEQHKLGGYETWLTTSRVEENASRKIVSTVMELFNELK